jgi:hypothetical protein
MRSLALFKISVTFVVLAACLLFSPISKAQSEIAPDHFDGTDSWEAAAHNKLARSKSQQAGIMTQANPHKPSSRATLQLTSKRQAPTRSGHNKSTMPDKCKVLAQNSKQIVARQ